METIRGGVINVLTNNSKVKCVSNVVEMEEFNKSRLFLSQHPELIVTRADKSKKKKVYWSHWPQKKLEIVTSSS